MATIKLGSKFFRKERDNLYSDWPTAFWREMLQNSMDAGAGGIAIRIKPLGSGCEVFFGDSGHGMTREVIENTFFALGETTKEGTDGVGGFGRARILTCFSMDSYWFRTLGCEVTGKGAEYEIADVKSFYYGCDFKIVIDDKSASDMHDALKLVLSRSQIDIPVTINGDRWMEWMHRRRLTRELDCGGVYVNNSQLSKNLIIVRVKGLYMFDMYTTAKPQVIVEIDPKRSRSILTVNRDSFHHAYQNNLTQFLAEIAIDKRSALRSRKRKTRLVRGLGVIVSESNRKPAAYRAGDSVSVVTGGSMFRRTVAETIAVSVGDSPMDEIVFGNREVAPASRPVDTVESEIVEGDPIVEGLPSVYINDETENPKVLKVISNFDPTKWVHAIKKVRGEEQSYRKGSTYLKLLLAWRTAVEEAMRALLVKQSVGSVSWMIGWDFSDDTEACHVGVEGSHAICLNPVDKNGQLRYKISSRKDLMAMMALAKHEVAHVLEKYHDEDFSSLHTDIDKEFDPWSTLRLMKGAIASVN
jgi:hypothetical protein